MLNCLRTERMSCCGGGSSMASRCTRNVEMDCGSSLFFCLLRANSLRSASACCSCCSCCSHYSRQHPLPPAERTAQTPPMSSASTRRSACSCRRVHLWLACAAAVPVLLTAASGTVYRLARTAGAEKANVKWLMHVHTVRCHCCSLRSLHE